MSDPGRRETINTWALSSAQAERFAVGRAYGRTYFDAAGRLQLGGIEPVRSSMAGCGPDVAGNDLGRRAAERLAEVFPLGDYWRSHQAWALEAFTFWCRTVHGGTG